MNHLGLLLLDHAHLLGAFLYLVFTEVVLGGVWRPGRVDNSLPELGLQLEGLLYL